MLTIKTKKEKSLKNKLKEFYLNLENFLFSFYNPQTEEIAVFYIKGSLLKVITFSKSLAEHISQFVKIDFYSVDKEPSIILHKAVKINEKTYSPKDWIIVLNLSNNLIFLIDRETGNLSHQIKFKEIRDENQTLKIYR